MRWLSFGLLLAIEGFSQPARGACPTTSISNGSTADATQVMTWFDCKSPIDSPIFTGNVGIGATTPVYKLQVLSSSANPSLTSVAGTVAVDGGVNTNELAMGNFPSSPYGSWLQAKDNFGSGGSGTSYPIALNPLGGNVGIGTTNPIGSFNVQGTNIAQQGAATNAAGVTLGVISSAPRISLDNGAGNADVGGNQWNIDNNAGALRFFSAGTVSVVITSTGNVGIGTAAPSYPLYVNGTAYASGAAGALSDRRHKMDVRPLWGDALGQVNRLRPVSFRWKEPRDDGMAGRQLGFIAQDVSQVMPSTVLIQKNAERTLGLKYNEIVAVLTRALQQEDAKVETLRRENTIQNQKIEAMAARLKALEPLQRTTTGSY